MFFFLLSEIILCVSPSHIHREDISGLMCGLPWPVGDMHLTSFPFTSECEKFHVTNGQPWPVGDSTNII